VLILQWDECAFKVVLRALDKRIWNDIDRKGHDASEVNATKNSARFGTTKYPFTGHCEDIQKKSVTHKTNSN